MTDLRELPGIGAGLAAELRAVGVRDAEALHRIGPAEAAQRLAELGIRDAAQAQQALAAALGDVGGQPAPPVVGVAAVVFTVGDLDAAITHYTTVVGLPVVDRHTDPPSARLGLGIGSPVLVLREHRGRPDATASADAPRLRLIVAGATRTDRVVEVADRWGNVVELVASTT